MAQCIAVLKVCQSDDAILPYGFDWTREFSRRWKPDSAFVSTVKIRPEETPTGFQYSSSGGQSGAVEPIWPTVLAGTVVDGSITWTAGTITDDSLIEEISTDSSAVTWSVSVPAGLTVEDEDPVISAGQQFTSAVLSGGVAGTTYTVQNEVVTVLGHEFIGRIVIKIV